MDNFVNNSKYKLNKDAKPFQNLKSKTINLSLHISPSPTDTGFNRLTKSHSNNILKQMKILGGKTWRKAL